MIKLVSFLTGRKIVLLLDMQGQIYRTLQKKKNNPFTGTPYCHVYWVEKIGLVNLHEDGTTSGKSFYIKKWMYE